MSSDLKIAIACHCPKSSKKRLDATTFHDSLYLHMNNDKGGVGISIEDTATYIDPFAGCDSWNDVVDSQPNSFDVLWAYNCSVEPFYRHPITFAPFMKYMSMNDVNVRETKGVTTDIFQKGWKLLKPGGVLIFGTDKDTNMENFISNVKPYMVNNWIIPESKISSEVYPFHIDDNPMNEPNIYFPFLIVFTKPLEGGRKLKSRKLKSRKLKSRKLKSRKLKSRKLKSRK
jgi:hypothetical protein